MSPFFFFFSAKNSAQSFLMCPAAPQCLHPLKMNRPRGLNPPGEEPLDGLRDGFLSRSPNLPGDRPLPSFWVSAAISGFNHFGFPSSAGTGTDEASSTSPSLRMLPGTLFVLTLAMVLCLDLQTFCFAQSMIWRYVLSSGLSSRRFSNSSGKRSHTIVLSVDVA